MGRQCNSINFEREGICVIFEAYPMIIIWKYSFTAEHFAYENALQGSENQSPLPCRELHCCVNV